MSILKMGLPLIILNADHMILIRNGTIYPDQIQEIRFRDN